MKLLLDENFPQDLRHSLAPHDVSSVGYMGWKGLKNGALLSASANAGFEVTVTLDAGLPYQQNPTTIPLSLVLVSSPSSDIEDLLRLIPTIMARLAALPARSIVRVP